MPSKSYWEKKYFSHFDCIIIGAGIVGLSAASRLKEKKPQLKVAVLESGYFNAGASTKNAGFACFGSPTEVAADLKQLPKNEVFELIALRQTGIKALISRLGKNKIGYVPSGGFELIAAQQIEILDQIDDLNQWLSPLFSPKPFQILSRKKNDFPFSKDIKNIISLPHEAQIDTGNMMFNLVQYAQKKGVLIFTGAKVEQLDKNNQHIQVGNNHPFHTGKSHTDFYAPKIIVCTNAFTPLLLPQSDIAPGRGQILITSALPKTPFKGVFHFNEGYYYFRNVGNRVLIGGARNLDISKEKTYSLNNTKKITTALKQWLQQTILPNYSFEIEQSWSGTMAFGKNKYPQMTYIHPNILLAAGMGGMGVAIGSEWGNRAADMILE